MIVKTLADKYHGRVWVEDRIKGNHAEGAEFVIELPLAKR
ncbi:MAG: ATP-binding protein [Methanomassiliicoccales archaeon]|nr:ATP-binding protein [Methanomassiliicoccales archaeon]